MVVYGVMSWNNVTFGEDIMQFWSSYGVSWEPDSWIVERKYKLLEVVYTRPQEQVWIEVGKIQPRWALSYLETEDNPYRYAGEKESDGLPLLTFLLGNKPIATLDKACLTRDSEKYTLTLEEEHLAMIPEGLPIKGCSIEPPYTQPLIFSQYSWPIQGLFTFHEEAPTDGIMALIGGYLRDEIGIALTDSLDKESMDDAFYRARMIDFQRKLPKEVTMSHRDYFKIYDGSVDDEPDVHFVEVNIPLCGGPSLAQMLHGIDKAYWAEREARYVAHHKKEIEPRDNPRNYPDIGLELLI